APRLTALGSRTLRLDVAGAFVDALAFDAPLARGDPESLAGAVGVFPGAPLGGCRGGGGPGGAGGPGAGVLGAAGTLRAGGGARAGGGLPAAGGEGGALPGRSAARADGSAGGGGEPDGSAAGLPGIPRAAAAGDGGGASRGDHCPVPAAARSNPRQPEAP